MVLPIFQNIPGDAGMTPTRVYLTTLTTPERYDREAVTYSLDASKFWNVATMFFAFGAYSSGVAEIVTVPEPTVNPLNYDPVLQEYSLDFSKFWNAANIITFGAY